MAKVKQLTVTCENRPGQLARIAKALGDAKVNILGFHATTSGSEGSVHLVVDNVNKAKKALQGAGLGHTEAEALRVELPHVPGALGKFAAKLADRGLNINSGYQMTGKGRKASVVLTVSDLDKAAKVR